MREEGHPTLHQHPTEGQPRVLFPGQDLAIKMSNSTTASSSLLAALNCRGCTHLIVGAGPLASTRCAQSLAAGAKPVLLAPGDAEIPATLRGRIEGGEVVWEKKAFEDGHLFSLGREDVGNVVDAVFVTLGSRDPLGTSHLAPSKHEQRSPVQH